VRRLRLGEWTAAIGAAGLVATALMPWFGFQPPESTERTVDFGGGGILNVLNTYAVGNLSPWHVLGWLTIAVAVVTFAAGAWLPIATLAARPLAQQVAAGILAATIGTFGFVILALRLLIFQPGPNDLITLRYGAYLGLLAALLVALGGWWAMKDDRTEAPESAYTPPAPRPAPPERAS
jgi:hypothetical protein